MRLPGDEMSGRLPLCEVAGRAVVDLQRQCLSCLVANRQYLVTAIRIHVNRCELVDRTSEVMAAEFLAARCEHMDHSSEPATYDPRFPVLRDRGRPDSSPRCWIETSTATCRRPRMRTAHRPSTLREPPVFHRRRDQLPSGRTGSRLTALATDAARFVGRHSQVAPGTWRTLTLCVHRHQHH